MSLLFIELANPDEQGFSRKVSASEFTGDRYGRLRLGNGGSWCRDDGPLARDYNVVRHKQAGRIVAVELQGFKKQPILKPIPTAIRKELQGKPCAVLGIRSVEVDHKDGRRDDPRLADANRVNVQDFQPLSKAANNAKREHCKRCRETGRRYDARLLGFSVGQVRGDANYNGTCIGCFWYDPKAFRAAASAR